MSECFYFFVLDSILKTSYESSSDLIFYDKMVSVISITFNGHMHLFFALSLRLSCGLCILNHLGYVLWIMLIGSLLYLSNFIVTYLYHFQSMLLKPCPIITCIRFIFYHAPLSYLDNIFQTMRLISGLHI